jgi:hypothetical protein
MQPASPGTWQRAGAQLRDAARAARDVADGRAARTGLPRAHPARTPADRAPGPAHDDDMSSAAVQLAAAWYQRTFHGRPDQVARVRREIAAHLDGCPSADDAVLIASELAANAVTHSASAGEFFTVRVEAFLDYVWIECEDLGGEWRCRPGDDRPHGLDIIETLAGPGNWGTEATSDGDRIVWARLGLPPDGGRT